MAPSTGVCYVCSTPFFATPCADVLYFSAVVYFIFVSTECVRFTMNLETHLAPVLLLLAQFARFDCIRRIFISL